MVVTKKKSSSSSSKGSSRKKDATKTKKGVESKTSTKTSTKNKKKTASATKAGAETKKSSKTKTVATAKKPTAPKKSSSKTGASNKKSAAKTTRAQNSTKAKRSSTSGKAVSKKAANSATKKATSKAASKTTSKAISGSKASPKSKTKSKKTTARSSRGSVSKSSKSKGSTKKPAKGSAKRSASKKTVKRRSSSTNDISDLEPGTAMHERLDELERSSQAAKAVLNSDMDKTLGLPPLPSYGDADSGDRNSGGGSADDGSADRSDAGRDGSHGKGLFSKVFGKDDKQNSRIPDPSKELSSGSEDMKDLDKEASTLLDGNDLKDFKAMEHEIESIESDEKISGQKKDKQDSDASKSSSGKEQSDTFSQQGDISKKEGVPEKKDKAAGRKGIFSFLRGKKKEVTEDKRSPNNTKNTKKPDIKTIPFPEKIDKAHDAKAQAHADTSKDGDKNTPAGAGVNGSSPATLDDERKVKENPFEHKEEHRHPDKVPQEFAKEEPHKRERPLKMEPKLNNGTSPKDAAKNDKLPPPDNSYRLSSGNVSSNRKTSEEHGEGIVSKIVSSLFSSNKSSKNKKGNSVDGKKNASSKDPDPIPSPSGDGKSKGKTGIFSGPKDDVQEKPSESPGSSGGPEKKEDEQTKPDNFVNLSAESSSPEVPSPGQNNGSTDVASGTGAPSLDEVPQGPGAVETQSNQDAPQDLSKSQADGGSEPQDLSKPEASPAPSPKIADSDKDDESDSEEAIRSSSKKATSLKKEITKLEMKKEGLEKELKSIEKEHKEKKTAFEDEKAKMNKKQKDLDKREQDLDERENILLTLQTDLIRERKELDNREFKLFMNKEKASAPQSPKLDVHVEEDLKSLPKGLSDERMKIEQLMNQTRALAINNDIDKAKTNYNRLVEKFHESQLSPNDKKILHLSIKELYNDINLLMSSVGGNGKGNMQQS